MPLAGGETAAERVFSSRQAESDVGMPRNPKHAVHPFLAGLARGLPGPQVWDAPAVVAVSGGADSVALLIGLTRIAPAHARIVVAHARHDLRATAADDERFVAALADRLGLESVLGAIAVREDPERRGEGLEARARRLRYDFLLDVARDRGARHVVVGHTADDQAETILHRILRGTGIAGLAGMRPARPLDAGIALVRPLLGVPRRLGRGFLTAEAEEWREDPTNADPWHARNFLRHAILAPATGGPYPAAAESIVRLAAHVDRSAAVIASAVGHLLDRHAVRHAGDRVVLDAVAVATLDRQLLAQLVAALWQREAWPRRDMTARHHEAVADLIAAAGRGDRPVPPAIDLPAGIRAAATSGGRVEFGRTVRPAAGQ